MGWWKQIEGLAVMTFDPKAITFSGGTGSLKDHLSKRICFPTWHARYKDN